MAFVFNSAEDKAVPVVLVRERKARRWHIPPIVGLIPEYRVDCVDKLGPRAVAVRVLVLSDHELMHTGRAEGQARYQKARYVNGLARTSAAPENQEARAALVYLLVCGVHRHAAPLRLRRQCPTS